MGGGQLLVQPAVGLQPCQVCYLVLMQGLDVVLGEVSGVQDGVVGSDPAHLQLPDGRLEGGHVDHVAGHIPEVQGHPAEPVGDVDQPRLNAHLPAVVAVCRVGEIDAVRQSGAVDQQPVDGLGGELLRQVHAEEPPLQGLVTQNGEELADPLALQGCVGKQQPRVAALVPGAGVAAGPA